MRRCTSTTPRRRDRSGKAWSSPCRDLARRNPARSSMATASSNRRGSTRRSMSLYRRPGASRNRAAAQALDQRGRDVLALELADQIGRGGIEPQHVCSPREASRLARPHASPTQCGRQRPAIAALTRGSALQSSMPPRSRTWVASRWRSSERSVGRLGVRRGCTRAPMTTVGLRCLSRSRSRGSCSGGVWYWSGWPRWPGLPRSRS